MKLITQLANYCDFKATCLQENLHNMQKWGLYRLFTLQVVAVSRSKRSKMNFFRFLGAFVQRRSLTHTAWIWIWITKRPGSTSENGFIFKNEINSQKNWLIQLFSRPKSHIRQGPTIFSKVQLNSEWIYEFILSLKLPTKNLKDFCPPTNKLSWQKSFRLAFSEKQWPHEFILNLTDPFTL